MKDEINKLYFVSVLIFAQVSSVYLASTSLNRPHSYVLVVSRGENVSVPHSGKRRTQNLQTRQYSPFTAAMTTKYNS